MISRKLQDNLAVVLLALFCLILYFNSLNNGFVFDDLHTITGNLYIKDFHYSPLFLKGYYTSSANIPKGMFRPLLLLTFSFNYFFSGLQPLGYHIINILLHFLNGALLYSLLRFLKKDFPFALSVFIGLLFIAHPLNSEPVNYLTCRSDLMASFFILLAFFSYAKNKFFLSLFLFLLALFTKETALAFPLLVFSYEFLRGPGFSEYGLKNKPKNKIFFYLALMGIAILYWLYRQYSIGINAHLLAPLSSPLRSFYSNILTQSAVSLFYLRLFILPHPLTIHHAFPIINSLLSPLAFTSLIILIIAILLIFILRKKQLLISLGIAWYLICLGPKFYAVLNVVAAEHHFYMPGFGIYFILAAVCQKLYLRFRRYIIYILSGAICIFALIVWFRNYEWRDAFSLWKSAAEADPRSTIALHNLAAEYLQKRKEDKAEELFKKTLSLSDSIEIHVQGRINLAYIRERQGKLPEAENLLKEALKIHRDNYVIYQFLGRVYLKMGRDKEAEETWNKGLALNPLANEIQVNLGELYLQKNDLRRAKEYFQSAIQSNPDDFLAYFDLGQVLEQEYLIEEAAEAYEKSLRKNPGYALTHYSLGTLYAQKANPRALWHLKITIKLAPNFAEAHNNLAVLYASMDPPQLELARVYAQKAISLGYKVDKNFLALIRSRQNGQDKK